MFIALEGLDGTGKTTVARELADRLPDAVLSHAPREPYRSAIFAEEKPAPLAELLLFLADIADTAEKVIAPALAAGRPVIQDRWTDSTIAYQLEAGDGRALDRLGRWNAEQLIRIAQGPIEPDLVLVLDAPLDVLDTRLGRRPEPGNRYDGAKAAFRRRVRAAYLGIEAPSPRHALIDAAQPLEAVVADCLRAIADHGIRRGDDGLTDAERRQHAAAYRASAGARRVPDAQRAARAAWLASPESEGAVRR